MKLSLKQLTTMKEISSPILRPWYVFLLHIGEGFKTKKYAWVPIKMCYESSLQSNEKVVITF